MVEQRDYIGLDWVISEIDTTLTEARQDLEAFTEASDDPTSLDNCHTKIQQVHSTLKVLKQKGARLLTREILLLLDGLKKDPKSDDENKLIMAIEAMLTLPEYLTRTSRTGEDNPKLLQKLLGEMRQLRGETPISDLEFFEPVIITHHRPIEEEQLGNIQANGFAPLLRKMRQKYQLSLAGILRDKQREQQLIVTSKIFAKLQNLCWDAPISPLWDAATALTEGLREGSIPVDQHIIYVLRELDNELKVLASEGVGGINSTPDHELLRNILYRIGKAESSNSLVVSIKHRYGLEKALSEDAASDSGLINVEATASVVNAIKEELAHVKDALDLYILNPEKNKERLQEQLPACQKITETLSMLGFDALMQAMQKESDSLHLILTSEQTDSSNDDSALVDVAAQLLEVEAGLNQLMAYTPNITGDKTSSSQLSDIHQTVIHEARGSLEQAKGALLDYLSSNENREFLAKIIPLLKSIQGSLGIIPLPRVSELIGRCANYIQTLWLDQNQRPELDELESVADTISSVEYYLEQLSHGVSSHTERTLDTTQQSIETLEENAPTLSTMSLQASPLQTASEPVDVEYESETLGGKVNPFASFIEDDEDKQTNESNADTDLHTVDFHLEPTPQIAENHSTNDTSYGASIDFSPTLSSYTDNTEQQSVEAALSVDVTLEQPTSDTIDDNQLEDIVIRASSSALHFEKPASSEPEVIDEEFEISLADLNLDGSQFEVDQNGTEIEESLELDQDYLDFSLDEDDEDISDIFVEEAGEVQQLLHEQFAVWRKDFDDDRSRADVRRAFHTLKGSGRMIGAEVIGELAWSIENMLNRIIDETITASHDTIQLIDDVIAMLPELVQAFADGNQQLTPEVLVCMERADALSQGVNFKIEEDVPDDNGIDEPAMLFGEEVPTGSDNNQQTPEELKTGYDQQLLEIFDIEAKGHLAIVKTFIEQFYQLGDSLEISDKVQRALHTLKGSAYMAEITPLADLIAAIEKTIKEFRAHLVPADNQVVSMLEQGIDLIEDALLQLQNGVNPIVLKVDNYLNWISALHSELLSNSLQDELNNEAPETTASQQGQQAALFLSSDLDLLLNAGSSLKNWVTEIPAEELERFKFELLALGESARKAGLSAMDELCDVLQGVCTYLDHETSLPEPILQPLTDGFETLVEMMNQVASQQTPESPQRIFLALQQALQSLPQEQTSAPEAPESEIKNNTLAASENLNDDLSLTPSAEPQVAPTQSFQPEAPTPSVSAANSEETENELRKLFLEEAFELLEDSAQALEVWLDTPAELQPVHELQRCLHTLKGGARMAELYELGELCHTLEDIYDAITSNRCPTDKAPLALIQKTHDTIESSLNALNDGSEPADATTMLDELQQWKQKLTTESTDTPVDVLPDYLSSPKSVQTLASSAPYVIDVVDEQTPPEESSAPKVLEPISTIKVTPQNQPAVESVVLQSTPGEMIRVSSDLLENLINLAGESSISRSRIEQQTTDTVRTLDEMNRTILRVREQLKRLDIETQTQIMSRHQGDLGENPDFDPLEMDQYSELSQLSHALVESASDLVDLREAMQQRTKDMEGLLMQQSRTQIELQEKLMKARMVSFSRLVPRLRKIVRQVSDELGKPVELLVTNAEGEMDRTMLERVLAPLEHMLRNAIGHGIETSTEERQQLGKPEVGQISIAIRRDGSDVVIELSDDGRGINIDAVKAKAIEQGLIGQDSPLSEQETLELIMRSGFSTASSVTQISGRGVGLDVVNSSVRQLGGSIQISSETGQGTHFSLRLPFTLSINRALMVEVGNSLYALPMHAIDGISMVSSELLTDCYRNQSPLVYGNGTEHQLIYMGALLGTSSPKIHESQCPVVLVQRGNDNIAVHVDSIIGSREIITKSLGVQFSGLAGVNGATILGDGRVVVILDPAALYRRHLMSNIQAAIREEPEDQERALQVLIVDDSVTVRKVTSRLLSRQGYEVQSARDGVEALAILTEYKPDIMLLDIEMPRMDGFEVASTVRNDPRLKDLPIIMITSRTGEKHRSRAMSLGVNEYIGKPFQEGPLLQAIKKLTATEPA